MEASPSDLEADSEASLFRAVPKNPASRMCPILRQTQPQRANPDDQRTAVIAAAVRQPGLALAPGSVTSNITSMPCPLRRSAFPLKLQHTIRRGEGGCS
jgi:hypothetical protein